MCVCGVQDVETGTKAVPKLCPVFAMALSTQKQKEIKKREKKIEDKQEPNDLTPTRLVSPS
ncbi:hypothetical protein PP707_05145 [Acetobacter pasteurianus]|nr:hypothetical protein [Acetobacter pasteurianus]